MRSEYSRHQDIRQQLVNFGNFITNKPNRLLELEYRLGKLMMHSVYEKIEIVIIDRENRTNKIVPWYSIIVHLTEGVNSNHLVMLIQFSKKPINNEK